MSSDTRPAAIHLSSPGPPIGPEIAMPPGSSIPAPAHPGFPAPSSANASERIGESPATPGNREIETFRPARNPVDASRPYHFLHEQEVGPLGPETVNTLFLTGKECAFKCLMCDLWKNTLEGPTPPGALVHQIDYALSRLPAADSIKLYNSSNFFDPKAVPVSDYPAILERVRGYRRVIVENHPRLVGDACMRFRDGLHNDRPGVPGATLEIAMGLETIHPVALPALNKQLTPEDFRRAARFLTSHGIRVRAFVLLNPPYITRPDEGIHWAVETVRFAFESGAHCCSIIATRGGNGMMEVLQEAGDYVPPTLDALEEVFAAALGLAQEYDIRRQVGGHQAIPHAADHPAVPQLAGGLLRPLVFVDTWDIGFISSCPQCFDARKSRLAAMNLTQTLHQPIICSCNA